MPIHRLSYISPKTTNKKKSLIHGRGLFATRAIQEGEVVAVKGGYVYGWKLRDKIEERFGPVDGQIGEDLFIGPVSKEEVEGCMLYLNHSCDPNVGVAGNYMFVALRDIKSGEELAFDYAMTDDENYKMKCNCRSKNCRKVITGRDWKKKELQKKYQNHFSWYLAEKIKKLDKK